MSFWPNVSLSAHVVPCDGNVPGESSNIYHSGWLLETILQRCLRIRDKLPKCGFFYTNYTHAHEWGFVTRAAFFFWRIRADEIIRYLFFLYSSILLENLHRHIWKTHKFKSQKDKWGKMGCNHVTSRSPAGVRSAKINIIETKSESHWNEMSRSHTPLFWKHTYTYSMPFQSRSPSQPNFHVRIPKICIPQSLLLEGQMDCG